MACSKPGFRNCTIKGCRLPPRFVAAWRSRSPIRLEGGSGSSRRLRRGWFVQSNGGGKSRGPLFSPPTGEGGGVSVGFWGCGGIPRQGKARPWGRTLWLSGGFSTISQIFDDLLDTYPTRYFYSISYVQTGSHQECKRDHIKSANGITSRTVNCTVSCKRK